MHIIHAKTPDEALCQALLDASRHSYLFSESQSRNGPVLRYKVPVTTVWSDPTNRILWNETRDANPFLHFIEAAWMLAGRNDLATVAKLTPQMASYSDDGHTLYGAYGYRWRHHFGFDQLQTIIEELRKNPETRRCVLQMWDGHEELKKAVTGGKDCCCNTAIYFDPLDGKLNMTVTNRSNDTVWGAYGANVVHMSILHEYVAAQTGLQLGTYYQMSNNLHLYTENEVTCRLLKFDEVRNKWATPEYVVPEYAPSQPQGEDLFSDLGADDSDQEFKFALITMFLKFLNNETDIGYRTGPVNYMRILAVLMNTFNVYKRDGAASAVAFLGEERVVRDSQWFLAAQEWLKRRPSYKKAIDV
jgi:thymidylate synthase